MIDAAFWSGKRVFLTGHTGFKGSWLSLWLNAMGAQVTGFALAPPTDPNLFETANVGSGLESILADIRDAAAVAAALRTSRAEIVIHMAAQPLVRLSYSEPVATYATNVMGTVHLLDAVRQTDSVRAVVVVSTDKCYENKEWTWGYREIDPMGGHDPYSSSKGCTELVASAYRASFFNPPARHRVAVATARAGNVIGGGDWAPDRLIPDMIAAMRDGRPVAIRNPHAIRPWQHVLEPLSGYLLLAEQLYKHGAKFAEAWNFGPNEDGAQPVQWLANHVTRLWGKGASWELDGTDHPHESSRLQLDIAKARHQLGWAPRWDLPTALEKTVEWYKAHQAGEDMRRMTLDQISDYAAAIS